jgi:hypothetical protein
MGNLAFKTLTGSTGGCPDRSTGFGIARLCRPSCRQRRIEFDFQLNDLVSQAQAALLESPQQQVVTQSMPDRAIDQAVKIGVFDAQLDQLTLRRMEVEFTIEVRLHGKPEFIVSIHGGDMGAM